MNFKKLKDCTVGDMVNTFNRGFEGYFTKIVLTEESFLRKLVNEDLSVQTSIMAWEQNEPVGIILSGIRTIKGKKTAWNGGTGVAPEFRSKGVGKKLMEEALQEYEREGVEVAKLEAIKANEKAIHLYKKYGYEITDELAILSGNIMPTEKDEAFTIRFIRPELLASYPFYKDEVPWQCQWESCKQGEAAVFYDGATEMGYALFKRTWNEAGNLESITLQQFQLVEPQYTQETMKLLRLLTDQSEQEIVMTTFNFSKANPVTEELLAKGFQIKVEQVEMTKILVESGGN